MTHLNFEEINEIVDGREPRTESPEARHLLECAACRETLRKVRELVSSAHALPRDIAPPPEVWTALRDRVARESGFQQRHWWHNGWLATAAAVVLVVGTAILTPNLAGRGKVSKAKAVQNQPVAAQPVVLAVDRNYASTVAELRATLDTQRPALAPSTVRTVERSLAVIDSAIAEAREALASDPANQALVDILSAHYERKVDLLQRASELSSSL
jgi:anti-sigma factor RsiW